MGYYHNKNNNAYEAVQYSTVYRKSNQRVFFPDLCSFQVQFFSSKMFKSRVEYEQNPDLYHADIVNNNHFYYLFKIYRFTFLQPFTVSTNPTTHTFSLQSSIIRKVSSPTQ